MSFIAVKWKKHEVFPLIWEFSWGTAVQIPSSAALIQSGISVLPAVHLPGGTQNLNWLLASPF